MPFGITHSAKPLPIQTGFLLNQKRFPDIPWVSLPQLKGMLEASEEHSKSSSTHQAETALEGEPWDALPQISVLNYFSHCSPLPALERKLMFLPARAEHTLPSGFSQHLSEICHFPQISHYYVLRGGTEVLHICLHKAGGWFKMNQLPPSTGRMTGMQRCTGFPWIWLKNKIITQCLQLSPHSVPLTPCSISVVPLWAHWGLSGMGWNPGSHVSSGWVGVIYSQEETVRAPKS